MAAADTARRELSSPAAASSALTPFSSDSSKVNGIPTSSVAGGRVQGQYIKRSSAPKPASNAGSAATTNGQSELEKVHARLRATRNIDLSALPDKPPAPSSDGASTTQQNTAQNNNREVSRYRTNLDKKKSASSIVLGQKDFEDDDTVTKMSPAQQASPMRRAQSREELYAIECQTRFNKDALLREIQKRRVNDDDEDVADVATAQWGLKGTSRLAQRLQQGRNLSQSVCSICW
jgi:hypothetical protein